MKNYLVISALGEDRPGLVTELTRAIMDSGCSIGDSRMLVLGGEFAMTVTAHGNWNTLAKLEMQLKRLEETLGMSVIVHRTEGRKRDEDALPYAVEVIARDQPGIVHGLAKFFSSRGINVEELMTRRYNAPHTGTPMFVVNVAVGIPSNMHVAMLRDEFMDFCDEMNLDAVLEPVKG